MAMPEFRLFAAVRQNHQPVLHMAPTVNPRVTIDRLRPRMNSARRRPAENGCATQVSGEFASALLLRH
jgi:hypothetical protein